MKRNAIRAIIARPTTPPTTPPTIAPTLLDDVFDAGAAEEVACSPLEEVDDPDERVCVVGTCVAVDSGRLVSPSATCGSKVPFGVFAHAVSKAHPGTAVSTGMS